jgi:hypothetical protein
MPTEKSGYLQTTRRHNPKDRILHDILPYDYAHDPIIFCREAA